MLETYIRLAGNDTKSDMTYLAEVCHQGSTEQENDGEEEAVAKTSPPRNYDKF